LQSADIFTNTKKFPTKGKCFVRPKTGLSSAGVGLVQASRPGFTVFSLVLRQLIRRRCVLSNFDNILVSFRKMNRSALLRLSFYYYSSFWVLYILTWILSCVASPSVIEFLHFCGSELSSSSEVSSIPVTRRWS
jgi:hypothetical protein